MGMVIIDELKSMLIEEGFNISGDVKHSDKFVYVSAMKVI